MKRMPRPMRSPRDPHHHTCVERQVYRGTALMVVGWLTALVLPFGFALLALLLALVAVPILELAWDGEERRRARLTPADRAAGRR